MFFHICVGIFAYMLCLYETVLPHYENGPTASSEGHYYSLIEDQLLNVNYPMRGL